MTKEALKDLLSSRFSDIAFPEINSEFLNISCDGSKLHDLAVTLKSDETLGFDFLFCLTALDWPENLEVIYHLRSTAHGSQMVLRVKTANRENPEIDTVSDIWPTAEFHEREVYDLFGIKFRNHPDLRRIFLEDDWVGYPLRKDYADEINIVDL